MSPTILIFIITSIVLFLFLIFGVKFILREKVEITSVTKRSDATGRVTYRYTGRVIDSDIDKTINFHMKEKKYREGDIVQV